VLYPFYTQQQSTSQTTHHALGEIRRALSFEFGIDEHYFPQVADVLLLADFQAAVVGQQSLAFPHAQLAFLALDAHESPVPPAAETADAPHLFVFRPHHESLLEVEEALREGVVNVCRYGFVLAVQGLLGEGLLGQGEFWFGLDQFPDVILGDVVGVEGAAGDLVELFGVGDFDLVGVEVVLGLEVAQNEGVGELVRFAGGVDLVQGLVEDVQFLLLHFHDAAHEDGPALVGNFGDGVVEILAEGGINIGGEAGLINAFLLVDHGGVLLLPPALPPVGSTLLVGLPLLLLRVANSH
jgi:hypothetical protein